mmetsp:Transcript_13088/g.23069  ORF Transcript_13088/g.23069 Transcript_13088/m.23069 type:complete len:100 (+) Transcript_13088:307-606(+)
MSPSTSSTSQPRLTAQALQELMVIHTHAGLFGYERGDILLRAHAQGVVRAEKWSRPLSTSIQEMPIMLLKCARPDGWQAPMQKVASCCDMIDDMITDER